MTTLKWNVKLLGNFSKQDFSVWVAAAKIPECYVFNITDSADGWGEYPELQEGTIPIPDEGNTLIITGKDKYDLFEPYCFEGHKCVMNAENGEFETGTKILSTIMTSDGLLDRETIESISNKLDMGMWIKKNYPEAAHCLDKMSECVDPVTGYLNSTGDAVKLENAICKYVLSSLDICKTTAGKPELPSTDISTGDSSIPPMYYVIGAGAAIAAGLGWYVWKETQKQ